MDLITITVWLFNTGKSLFDSILTDWGIIGLGILSTFLIIRVVNFMKRFFK